MTRNFALISGAVAAGLIGFTWYMTQQAKNEDKFAQCRTAQIAGGANQIGGPFTLIDETGKTVTDKDVIDQPTLLYFGYAFCPDVCPMDNARNAETIDVLDSQGRTVKPVFISVDPKRDTPEVLADFTENLHDRMVGLTGTPEQIKAASKAYRTYFKVNEPAEGDEEYYLIDHSTFTYLVFPEEGFVEFFRRDLEPEKMAEQIGCFLDAR